MEEPQQIPLIAGYNRNDEAVVEKVNVQTDSQSDQQFRVTKSPVFVPGLAAEDLIRFPAETANGFELITHGGNLSIRVFGKHNTNRISELLTPEMELIQGRLDVSSPGVLVYTIHVSIGFRRIEDTLDAVLKQFPDSIWYYGNVYDPEDGSPLNWWESLVSAD